MHICSISREDYTNWPLFGLARCYMAMEPVKSGLTFLTGTKNDTIHHYMFSILHRVKWFNLYSWYITIFIILDDIADSPKQQLEPLVLDDVETTASTSNEDGQHDRQESAQEDPEIGIYESWITVIKTYINIWWSTQTARLMCILCSNQNNVV